MNEDLQDGPVAPAPVTPAVSSPPAAPLPSKLPDHPAFVLSPKPKPVKLYLGLVGVVVLLLAVGLGVYEWQQSKVKQLNHEISGLNLRVSTLNAQIITTMQNQAATQSSKNTSSATFLSIKELNFKVPLSSAISDLKYVVSKNSKGQTYLNFTTQSLLSAGGQGCAISSQSTNSPLGTVLVLSNPSTNPGTADNQDGALLASVSGHYLYYHHAQSTCATSDTASSLQNLQSDALIQSLTDSGLISQS